MSTELSRSTATRNWWWNSSLLRIATLQLAISSARWSSSTSIWRSPTAPNSKLVDWLWTSEWLTWLWPTCERCCCYLFSLHLLYFLSSSTISCHYSFLRALAFICNCSATPLFWNYNKFCRKQKKQVDFHLSRHYIFGKYLHCLQE